MRDRKKKPQTLLRSLRIQTQVVLELLLLIALGIFVTHSTIKEELFNCVVYKINWNSHSPYQSYRWENETGGKCSKIMKICFSSLLAGQETIP